MLYRVCNICGKRVPYRTKCECELKQQKERYKTYKNNRTDTREQKFYSSKEWERVRENISRHQFGMDLIDWYNREENIQQAELYHHIIELKDDWSLRFNKKNIIGLTQQHHMKIHSLMSKNDKYKERIQNYLKRILKEFEDIYYKNPGE